jgi:hypothetical protein
VDNQSYLARAGVCVGTDALGCPLRAAWLARAGQKLLSAAFDFPHQSGLLVFRDRRLQQTESP